MILYFYVFFTKILENTLTNIYWNTILLFVNRNRTSYDG